MKSLKHFASFDWSAEIDEGHMLSWILNVAAAGPETGPETWLQALAALRGTVAGLNK